VTGWGIDGDHRQGRTGKQDCADKRRETDRDVHAIHFTAPLDEGPAGPGLYAQSASSGYCFFGSLVSADFRLPYSACARKPVDVARKLAKLAFVDRRKIT
jgi:hypothetical protein